jgi:peptidyl-tRNA hydrolase ICT1
MEDVTVKYARSGGPGGQNVNKLNTKVDMRFNVLAADFLPDWVKEELLESQSGRINSEGTLSVTSERSRSQVRNRDDALAKLKTIVTQASHVPPPPSAEVQRRVRSRIKRGNEQRIQGKKRQQNKKAQRKEWR